MSKPRIQEEAWAGEVYGGNEGRSFKKFGCEEEESAKEQRV